MVERSGEAQDGGWVTGTNPLLGPSGPGQAGRGLQRGRGGWPLDRTCRH